MERAAQSVDVDASVELESCDLRGDPLNGPIVFSWDSTERAVCQVWEGRGWEEGRRGREESDQRGGGGGDSDLWRVPLLFLWTPAETLPSER